ncbi:MAG: methyltransferase [Rikenellaceae bacterium]
MFRFKQFAIEQDRTPMKVGTDGVLLGAWVATTGEERHILDIGTGTGVIALMMAQRTSAQIDAVEIDYESATQAAQNVEASRWRERMTVHHTQIQHFAPTTRYDLIVTNPPYFVDSLLSLNAGRTTARHTTELSFAEIVESAARLLTPDGRLAIILPTQEAQRFEAEATPLLSAARRCDLYSREGGALKRIMCEYKLTPPTTPLKQEQLTIESGRPPEFTAEYRELTRDFYLKF